MDVNELFWQALSMILKRDILINRHTSPAYYAEKSRKRHYLSSRGLII